MTECKINDPDFDEEIFRIALAPDTAVFDSRYKVNYRIGREQVFTDQLAALAGAAQGPVTETFDHPNQPFPRRGGGMKVLIWANVGLIVGLLIWLGYRRYAAE